MANFGGASSHNAQTTASKFFLNSLTYWSCSKNIWFEQYIWAVVVAQLVEQSLPMLEVRSPNPVIGTISIEHFLLSTVSKRNSLNIWKLFGLFWNMLLLVENSFGYILDHHCKIWATFNAIIWSHWQERKKWLPKNESDIITECI